MTAQDHQALYAAGAAPAPADLDGVWRMDTISNANHAGGIAYLQFSNKPDGRFEARYELMGLMEGLVVPSFLKDHFQLNDFTPFHDEIRKVTADFLVGTYMTALPPAVAALLGSSSLGLFHAQANGQFGFYYTLTRMTEKELPTNHAAEAVPGCAVAGRRGHDVRRADEGLVFPGRVHAGRGARGRSHDRQPHSGDGRPGGRVHLRVRRAYDDGRRQRIYRRLRARGVGQGHDDVRRIRRDAGGDVHHRRIDQPFQLSAGEPGDRRGRDALSHRIRRRTTAAGSHSRA